MKPQDLKSFRKHFKITCLQAARLLKISRNDWWRMETGLNPVPDGTANQLQLWTSRLNISINRQAHRCFYCNKHLKNDPASCPYCGRRTDVSFENRVKRALPAVELEYKYEKPWRY